VHEATCDAASVAVHETGVVPTGKSDPEFGTQLVVIGCVPPATVGVANDTATGLPFGDVAPAMVGHVMLGSGAATVTVEEHVATCCAASVAVQVNGVVPTGNELPEAGVQVFVTVPVPPVKTGFKVTGIEMPSGDWTVTTEHEIASVSGAV
jgi:hypothetical protein